MDALRSECRDLALPIDIQDANGGEIDKKYTWLFVGDRLVAKRNHDCALFLKRQAERGLAERLQAYSSIAPGLKVAATWRVSFAGVLGFEPVTGGKVVLPKCGKESVTLYAMRTNGDKCVLHPVLMPKDGTWSRTPYADSIGISEGEPLFRFMSGAEPRDPEQQLKRTLETAPADIREEVLKVFHCE